MSYYSKENKMIFWFSLVPSILLFATILLTYRSPTLVHVDLVAGNWIRNFQSNQVTYWMTLVTQLGSIAMFYAFFIFSSLYLLLRKKELQFILAPFALCVLSISSNLGIKDIAQRPRPSVRHLVEANGWSFPSGHATTVISLCAVIAYVIWTSSSSKGTAWIIYLLLIAIVLLVGSSRVYLGVHYPTDVIAGYAWGMIFLSFIGWEKHSKKRT